MVSLKARRLGAGAAAGASGSVRVDHLKKTFRREDGTTIAALDDVSIDIHPGEFLVLLGPSGCGKTTLLRCIAGLEQPESGEIEIDGRLVFSAARKVRVPPESRRLSMIFQSYALWPHMTVFDNIAYPLKCRKHPRSQIEPQVRSVLSKVGIGHLADQYPAQISGGQQQRVALARAIVSQDSLVLFDEPLSNVDAKVREQLRLELISMQREIGFSALYVTHDQTEAMELGHRVAVMREGDIAQLGTPREIYGAPTSRYVANFIGTTNEIEGSVGDGGGDEIVVHSSIGSVVAGSGAAGFGRNDAVVAICRPESCELSLVEPSGANRFRGTVSTSLYAGAYTEHVVTVGEVVFRVRTSEATLFDNGAEVWLSIPPSAVRMVPLDGARSEVGAVAQAET
jgi:iron(III) transport system ATP-binding protein